MTWSWIRDRAARLLRLERRRIEKRLRAVIDRSTTEMLPPPRRGRPASGRSRSGSSAESASTEFLAVLAALHPDHAQVHVARATPATSRTTLTAWSGSRARCRRRPSPRLVAGIDRRRTRSSVPGPSLCLGPPAHRAGAGPRPGEPARPAPARGHGPAGSAREHEDLDRPGQRPPRPRGGVGPKFRDPAGFDYDKGISVAVPFSALYARMDQDSRDRVRAALQAQPRQPGCVLRVLALAGDRSPAALPDAAPGARTPSSSRSGTRPRRTCTR